MSVMIKDLEKPADCLVCIFSVDGCCIINRALEPDDELTHSCPLIEVPKHGPLVDSNRLIDIALHLMHTAKNDYIADGVKWLWQYIIEAPTIIEAEGGE